MDTSLTWFFIDIVSWNLPFKGMAARNVLSGMLLYTSLLTLFLLYPILLFSVALYAYSQIEVKDARHLKSSIQQIGKQKEIRGMAVE